MQPAVTPATRPAALERLRSEIFDVLILGGGINGAGTARDLALRAKIAGTRFGVALVEQAHFASGTSGKNSHLIHGGLRYLKQFDIGLVRESLRERAILLRIAPHLVEPLPFLLPVAGMARELLYRAGLALYDRLGTGGLPRHRRIALAEVHRLEPGLAAPGMTACLEYYDARVRAARVVLENVFESISLGAVCANYVRAEEHSREDGVWRIRLRDVVSNRTFDARARALVDATGPWARDPAPRLVRGSHIIVPRLNASDRAIAYFEPSGRIIFFIPWGDRTLIGTTDVDHRGPPGEVHISEEEIAYLRGIAARVFPASATLEILGTFSSLRPLLASSGPAARASRDHRIFFDSQGILRITGGKFTTYRAMSEEAADLIAPKLKHIHATADRPLNGNTREAIAALLAAAPEIAARYSIEPAAAVDLVKTYGVLTRAVLECLEGASDVTAARQRFAEQHEMAQKPSDALPVL